MTNVASSVCKAARMRRADQKRFIARSSLCIIVDLVVGPLHGERRKDQQQDKEYTAHGRSTIQPMIGKCQLIDMVYEHHCGLIRPT